MMQTIVSEILYLAILMRKPAINPEPVNLAGLEIEPKPAPGIETMACVRVEESEDMDSDTNVNNGAKDYAVLTDNKVKRAVLERKPAGEVQSIIDVYANKYGVDAQKMKNIASCESGFRPEALSGNGLYGGMYQFADSTWISNRIAMGADPNPALRFNAEEAVQTAAFKMSRDGYGAWPVCGQI